VTDDHADIDLREREKLRRKALWTLSMLQPGDPKAKPVVDVLDDIDRRGASDKAGSVDELDTVVVTELKAHGLQIVHEASIPQPWRERFLQASMGSTRHADGPYLHDFQKFIVMWKQEMEHLQAHQIAKVLERKR
jgi:hypothetical protein